MARQGRYFNFITDATGVPVNTVTVSVRKQGATCDGTQSSTLINVHDPGGIRVGDIVRIHEATGDAATVDAINAAGNRFRWPQMTTS